MHITKEHITQAIKIWNESDSDFFDGYLQKQFEEQPILFGFIQEEIDDFEFEEGLEEELYEMLFFVYLVFKQYRPDFPKVSEETLTKAFEKEEKQANKILEKLNIPMDADEETKLAAMEDFYENLFAVANSSEKELSEFVANNNLKEFLEDNMNIQPELEMYINNELNNLEDTYNPEDLSVVYDVMTNYISILSMAADSSNLKIVK